MMLSSPAIAAAAAPISDRCEIDYSSIPDSGPLSRLTDAEAASLREFRRTTRQDRAFLKSFQLLTDQVVAAATVRQKRPIRFSFQTILGGYRGRTSSSVAAQTTQANRAERDELERIGAAIGYVYLQDSVLVHCRASAGETVNTVRTYDITERSGADVINPGLLKAIYGVLIGEADGDLTIGFSYYPETDMISVIEPRGADYSDIVQQSVRHLGIIARTPHHFVVRSGYLWLTTPSNDWRRSPYGEEYIQRYGLLEMKPELDRLQQRFLEMVRVKFATSIGKWSDDASTHRWPGALQPASVVM